MPSCGLADGEDEDYFGSFLDNYNVTSSQSAVNFLVNHALAVMPFTFDDVCAEGGVAAVSLFQKPFSFQDLLLPPADSVNGLEQVRLFLTYYGVLYCTDRKLVRQADGSRRHVFVISASNSAGRMASSPLRRALSATDDQVVQLLRAPTPALVRSVFQSFVNAPTLAAAQARKEQARQQAKSARITGSTERGLNEAGFQFGARVFFEAWVRYARRDDLQVTVEAKSSLQDGHSRCDLVLHEEALDEIILFELKRIPVSCLDYKALTAPRGFKTPLKAFLKGDDVTTAVADDTILDLLLVEDYELSGETAPEGTRYHARDIVSGGSVALKRYKQNFSLSGNFRHLFCVLLMHNHIVVVEGDV